MASPRGWMAKIVRALELDRLFDGETGFFVRHREEAHAADAAGGGAAPGQDPPSPVIRVGPAFISPTVSPRPDDSPRAGSPFATSFVASWRPVPNPPEEWIRFLLAAPFGTQTTAARDLRWNGREISVERVTEKEIEAFASMMEGWAEYANRELASSLATPEARANFEAQSRARQLQEKLRR
ncbi:MAG: hypothetical protein ACRD16_03225 [Thermoanaerobaculia bacterium]